MQTQNVDNQETDVFGTDWKKPPALADLIRDFKASQADHDVQVSKIKTWTDNMNLTGSAKYTPPAGRSGVQPRLIRKQAEWKYPTLSAPFLTTEKVFSLAPRTWDDVKAARQNEAVLNYQFDMKLNKRKLVDDISRTLYDEGTAILRVGWNRISYMAKKIVPVYAFYPNEDEEYLSQLDQAMGLFKTDMTAFRALPDEMKEAIKYFEEAGQAVVAQVVDQQEIEEEVIVENHPTVQVVNNANIYIDPTCDGDLSNAQFIVHTYETSLSELNKSGKYKNLKQIELNQAQSPDFQRKDYSANSNFQFKDDARKKLVAHEYWGFADVNGDGKTVAFVATWINNVLIQLEENPFPDKGLPFVAIPYMPVRGSVFGEPDAELLIDNQNILGALTRGMIDLMARSANSQQGMPKQFLDAPNRRRYDQGLDYEYNPTMGIPSQVIVQHTYPQIPDSAIQMIQGQLADAESLTGTRTYDQGLSNDGAGRVVAGIRAVTEASSRREMDVIRRIADGLATVGKKIVAMNGSFLSEEEVIRITDVEFIEVDAESLKGSFDVIVDVASADADDAKGAELGFLLQTLGNSVPFDMTKLMLAELARLRKMPQLAHTIENYEPQPDPMKQALDEAELQIRQAQAQEVQAKVQKAQTEAMRNQAQAEYYMSAARQMGSQADLNDLDFLEQESGAKHARELQIQQAQGEANQDLAVTKGLVQKEIEDTKGEHRSNLSGQKSGRSTKAPDLQSSARQGGFPNSPRLPNLGGKISGIDQAIGYNLLTKRD